MKSVLLFNLFYFQFFSLSFFLFPCLNFFLLFFFFVISYHKRDYCNLLKPKNNLHYVWCVGSYLQKWVCLCHRNHWYCVSSGNLGQMTPPPRGLTKGPQENDKKLLCHRSFWMGHRNFTAWIKYFKFKIESNFPASLHAHTIGDKVVFYCFSHSLSCWIFV